MVCSWTVMPTCVDISRCIQDRCVHYGQDGLYLNAVDDYHSHACMYAEMPVDMEAHHTNACHMDSCHMGPYHMGPVRADPFRTDPFRTDPCQCDICHAESGHMTQLITQGPTSARPSRHRRQPSQQQ